MKSILAATIIGLGNLAASELVNKESIPKTDEQEKTSYWYAKLADQWAIFPGLGVGYRTHEKHGFDVDFSGYSYYDSGFSLYGKAHYLFYPTRNHFYLGIGAGIIGGSFSIFKEQVNPFISPTVEGIIGCEWNAKVIPIFIQLELGVGIHFIYPILSLGIGF